MSGSKKRIQKDFKDLAYALKNDSNFHYENDPLCCLDDLTNMKRFTIILKGPDNGPYKNGKFRLLINMPNEYPFEPPIIKFITKIYHPNIENDPLKKEWDICLDILKDNWKASYNLQKVLDFIYSLLENPNSADPLSADVNHIYQTNYELFLKTAEEWVNKYAL